MRTVRAILAAALLLPVPALAQNGVTKTEIRSQSPEATAREMRDQLWSIFEPRDLRSKTPPQAVLRDVLLSTPAYPSSAVGLCRSDSVTLHFAPVDPGERRLDANTPVRAQGLDVWHQYHQVAPLVESRDRDNDWFNVRGRRVCAALDKETTYFSADSDEEAADSVRLAGAVVAALAGGKVVPGCKDKSLPAGKTCAEMAEGLTADSLWWRGECNDTAGAGPGCAQINLGSQAMNVHFRRATANAPIEIVSVDFYDEIVIADSLID
jgi:hypothetical protein